MKKENNSFEDIQIAPSAQTNNGNNPIDVDILPISKQEAIRFGQDTKHRKLLVIWMIIVVSIWLSVVLLITMFNKLWCLNIAEKTLITLLATTTINVLGLSKIILNGLFDSKTKNKE